MAALVAPGAPVSVLLDYGMTEAMAERLLESGIGTIEKLGAMTPEELEAIQGIGAESVGPIQEAVVAYYSQFEDPASESAEPAAEGGEVEAGAEVDAGAEVEVGAEVPEAVSDEVVSTEEQGDEAETVSAEGEDAAKQFGTIESADSPHNHTGNAGPEHVPEEGSGE
jgi:N utilization substance protein A